MNNLKRHILFNGLFSLFLFTACSDVSKSALSNANRDFRNTTNDVKQAANSDIEAVKTKVSNDWQKFKSDSDASIIEMNKQIAELYEKIGKAKDSAKAGLKVQLAAISEKISEQKEKLNRKSLQMEADLKKFDENLISRNESFQREFQRDMNELGTAIKNLFKDNVK